MKPILFALFYENTADNNEQSNPYLALSRQLFESGAFEEGGADIRRFPDGESYVRVLSECGNREVLILANLHHPDDKLLPLLFFCQTLKDQSAAKVTLIAPYLPYMRQDKRFHEGECITSATFASLISPAIDQLITIDPHLHRYHSLSIVLNIKPSKRTK